MCGRNGDEGEKALGVGAAIGTTGVSAAEANDSSEDIGLRSGRAGLSLSEVVDTCAAGVSTITFSSGAVGARVRFRDGKGGGTEAFVSRSGCWGGAGGKVVRVGWVSAILIFSASFGGRAGFSLSSTLPKDAFLSQNMPILERLGGITGAGLPSPSFSGSGGPICFNGGEGLRSVGISSHIFSTTPVRTNAHREQAALNLVRHHPELHNG